MRRPNQLVLESAVIVSVMIVLTLGGSVVTTTTPGSFLPLQNPNSVTVRYNLAGLADYYNATLTEIGRQDFANASFLLNSFMFVNIPSNINGTAQAANADLASLNTTIPKALTNLAEAKVAIQANELVNATALINTGCASVLSANKSLADFSGPRTASFQAESVPTSLYTPGLTLVSDSIHLLHEECGSISTRVPNSTNTSVLIIGSPQKTIETGGSVKLLGNLTRAGAGLPGQEVYFYVNGSYFGSLVSDSNGAISGTLDIPFVYSPDVVVQALVAPNSTAGIGGARSNKLSFLILFDQTSILIGDPPAYLPGATFRVHGNLTTNGVPLPDAPVTVTFLSDSIATTTDSSGTFGAQFTVPNNATDGTYHVYARFSPMGVYGPSFNFTSIDVYHLHLALVLSVPGLSWAGFSTHIGGTATSNTTAVANAAITLVSPWGTFTAKTDSTGHFDIVLPISPLEFASSKNVTVTVSPPEPYIAGSKVVVTLGLFNILVVVVPAAIIGVAGYEAYGLGVFQELRTRVRGRERETVQLATLEGPALESLPAADRGPEPLRFFGRALLLASTRFSIVFRPSQTIREMLSLVKAKDDGEAFVAFSRVLLTAEDFLYGQRFDSSRTEDARKALFALQVLWS
jgi:hypothetical protein